MCHLKGFYKLSVHVKYEPMKTEMRQSQTACTHTVSQTNAETAKNWNETTLGRNVYSFGHLLQSFQSKKRMFWHFVSCLKFLSHAKGGAIFYIRSPLVKLADYTSKLERYRSVCVDLTDDT